MRVAVVIPVFNNGRYIAEALDSVLAQTYRDLAIYPVNDGSEDNSGEILDAYAKQDSRICVTHQQNRGHGVAINVGLERADTEWVFCMDGDDVMLPNRIERQLEFIQRNPEVRVCSCRARYIDQHGRIFGMSTNDVPSRDVFDAFVKNGEAIGLLTTGVGLHRRSVLAIGGYRQQFFPADDIDLWNRLAERGDLILTQDEVLMHYRIHGGSFVTSNFVKTRMRYEWVRACMSARRSAVAEPTWEEFLDVWNAVSLPTKMNRWRKMRAKALYRAAGREFLMRRRARGTIKLAAATLLQPQYALARARHQMLQRAESA